MAKEKSITLREAVGEILAQLDGPISLDEFTERILALWPSKAKNPRASIRNHLRWEGVGKTLVFLDRQTIVPLHVAMRGVRFRIPLSRQEVKRGVLIIDPSFHYFLRREIPHQDVHLLDASGRLLPTRVVTLKQKVKTILEPFTRELPAFDLGDWFRAHRVRRNDSILVTVEDWGAGRFRLEHEPARRRRHQEIERKNQELADLIFEMLEAARDEYVFAEAAVTTAYARMSDPRGYPGDHWVEVITRDPRMRWDGVAIRYSDYRSLLERVLLGEEERGFREKSFSPAQARQVYRFKAALRYRPGLWRRIEIQGGQTLAEFDMILRDTFQHDPFDHLSGFWKRVRRGTGKRFREMDLGDINPFGEGSGADLRVAGLGLAPGDQLKYVYDFGDWVEHLITLEEIVEPEEGAKYPRVIARNRPRHRYCVECKAEGRKTVATWICIDCSNAQQRDVLLCEECLDTGHEDHYATELVY
ncbi:MAG: hypothetical protein ACE5MB_03190 [Anaerolineae bacterium]